MKAVSAWTCVIYTAKCFGKAASDCFGYFRSSFGDELAEPLPCEQRFLSCMAFSVYEVVRVHGLSGCCVVQLLLAGYTTSSMISRASFFELSVTSGTSWVY